MSFAESLAFDGENGFFTKGLPPPDIRKVVSGGQTGAGRAALDWAIAGEIEHGGYCPKGRVAEDGVIPDQYNLTETEETEYSLRTKRNVEESDATLILTLRREMWGGARETARQANAAGKEYLHLSRADRFDVAVYLRSWVRVEAVHTLNVAGSREGEESGIYEFTRSILDVAFPRQAQRL